MKRTTETHRMDWKGMLLEITYEPHWLPARIVGEELAHLRVRSIYPTDAPLPIARKGYYSEALPSSLVAAAGGPVAYVDVMLAAEGGGQ
jgi:hypothetical protein